MLMLVVLLGWLLTSLWVVAVCVVCQRGETPRTDGGRDHTARRRRFSLR